MNEQMKSAVIKEIELLNYRVFKKAKIRFDPKEGANVSIIQGVNGFGKSNIYNAINWCFFNHEPHLRQDSLKLPICNTGTLRELKSKESIETTVTITLRMPGSGAEKRVQRTLLTHKTGPSTHYVEEPKLTVMEQVGKQWKIAPDPGYVISRILPEGMSHFFFIDGEQLREMFTTISPDKIKDAIFELSQITLLQNAIEHLDRFSGIVRREGGIDQDNVLKMAQDQIDIVERKIANAKKEIATNQEQIEKARANKRKLDEQVADLDISALQRFEEKRKTLESEIASDERLVAEVEEELREYLFQAAPVVLLNDAITATLVEVNKLKKQNKLPPDYQSTFLQRLLKEMECICGADLKASSGKVAHEKLKQLLAECEAPDFHGEATALLYRLEPIKSAPSRAAASIKRMETRLSELNARLVNHQKSHKEVTTKIGEIDVDKVKIIHRERESLQSQIRECESTNGRLRAEISRDTFAKTEADKQLRRLLQKQDRFRAIEAKLAACDESKVFLGQIKEKLMGEIRIEAEANTQKYFKHLISAKKFGAPRIDENYNLIVEKDGYNAVTSLSAAETLCMGYSFMAALRKTSGFSAPIIIDTPLAKISSEYRSNVATWMKEALSDAQVILLVSDVEYTEQFRKSLSSIVVDEYLLKHDEHDGVSEVTTYGR